MSPSNVRSLTLAPLLAAAALWSGSAAAAEDDALAFQPGVRLGVAMAMVPEMDPLPMANAYADLRITNGKLFLAFAPGIYLPGGFEGDLSYGGVGLELGGGWMMSEGAVSPYLGTGVSSRLQLSEQSIIGFAPYAQLGVAGKLSGTTGMFVEARAYQNVLAVTASRQEVFPTELGMAFGVTF
jgi:hypothetical protein